MVTLEGISKSKLEQLKKFGFHVQETATPHEELRMKGVCSVTLYKSGKLLIQGKVENVDFVTKLLAKDKIVKKRQSGFLVGSDETLKGDTFGGLIVAAFRADEKIRADLSIMGVKDSKKLSDLQIKKIAIAIKRRYPRNFSIVALRPIDYNKRTARSNVTVLLNKLHKECFQKLVKKGKTVHIVDKYPGCTVGDIVETKAESKYVEVAAASILARDEALSQFVILSRLAGFTLPMGSTHVASALKKIKAKGLNPKYIVKMNFSNVKKEFKQ